MNLSDLRCINDIDLEEYIRIRDDIRSGMEHPEYLGDMSIDAIKSLLSNGEFIRCYYLGTQFVSSMMFIPADKEMVDTLGADIDYKYLGEVGPMFVAEKFRGNGLQLKMLEEIEKFALDKGYKYMMSTVDPNNIYSSNNLLKANYQVILRKSFKRGIRDIYFKSMI